MLGRNAHFFILLLGLIALLFSAGLLGALFPGNEVVQGIILTLGLLLLFGYLKKAAFRSSVMQRQEQAERIRAETQRRNETRPGTPLTQSSTPSYGSGPQDDEVVRCTNLGDLYELRAMNYEEYLQTSHWKLRREEKLRTVGYRCQLCNRGSGILDVHHRTYERLGQELNEDLTVLCRLCHSTFHEHRRLGS